MSRDSRRSSFSNNENNSHGELSPKVSLMYDESIDVPDAEDIQTPPPPGAVRVTSDHASTAASSTSNHRALLGIVTSRVNSEDSSAAACDACHPQGLETGGKGSSTGKALRQLSHPSSSEEDDDDESEEEVHAETIDGAYDPTEFEHLSVSPEVKELFTHITRYTPQTIDLEFNLRPFVPDFIPAVGDIDAFIKIPRPDNKEDGCGLNFLDEPSGKQSDPAVLDLQLRALTKQSSARLAVVKRIEHAERNSRTVDKWIRDISDLHRSRPPPSVHYSKKMPDIDTLMQEWPITVEQRLQEIGIPVPDIDCDLASYVDIICGKYFLSWKLFPTSAYQK
ncbi:hypothetical protein B566_EDAN010184 [Ephemera danica]|nr:hypothetical protein B566_EDAN010184 [Ephemera danica]